MNRLGICIAGLNGAVASTAVAGMELISRGRVDPRGLITEEFRDSHFLTPLDDLVIAGWDVRSEDLLESALRNGVLDPSLLEPARKSLRLKKPWKAPAGPMARRYRQAAQDIERFRRREKLDAVVLINLIPTGANAESRSYAQAAVEAGCPFINFTPNESGEEDLASIPYAGRDGKTGQTWLKSVLAPALRSRALRISGWYSTNLLGNEDGRVVGDEAKGKAKIQSKTKLLSEMLGYEPHHQVQINYYPPRGDGKESWDSIDFEGFLGMGMQLKVNGLWRDSILAAPMCIDLARFIELARRRGESGPQEWLGLFFKSPYRRSAAGPPVHDFHLQELKLLEYLAEARGG
jgi:myo-inositol-1-phosphate synthase